MKLKLFGLIALLVSAGVFAAVVPSSRPVDERSRTFDEGKMPVDYRDWRLVSVAREEGDLDDIRAVLGNDVAIKAYRDGVQSFPDGAIIARLAWELLSSDENDKAFGKKQSFVAGRPKHGVQFMVKDSTRYATTGGWGYSQFDDGKPLTNDVTLQKCFTCHQAVKDRDFLFTRYSH